MDIRGQSLAEKVKTMIESGWKFPCPQNRRRLTYVKKQGRVHEKIQAQTGLGSLGA
jgi:hypothetical protein